MFFNELDELVYSLTLRWIPLLSNLIPDDALTRHETRNCLLMIFNGGGAAPVRHRIAIELRCTKRLVRQVPIDVNVRDFREPILGEYCVVDRWFVLGVIKEGHQRAQAEGVTIRHGDVSFMSIFLHLPCLVTVEFFVRSR